MFTSYVQCRFSRAIYYDDTDGMIVFGGTEMAPSFKGYIGSATLYRTRLLTLKKVKSLVG